MQKITLFILVVLHSLTSFAQMTPDTKKYFPYEMHEKKAAEYRKTPMYAFLKGEPFSAEVQSFISANELETYTYPCAAKISDHSKSNFSAMATGSLYDLMIKMEYQIRDFLECAGAEKLITPLEGKVKFTQDNITNRYAGTTYGFFVRKSYYSESSRTISTLEIDFSKFYENGDTYFIGDVIDRKSLLRTLNKHFNPVIKDRSISIMKSQKNFCSDDLAKDNFDRWIACSNFQDHNGIERTEKELMRVLVAYANIPDAFEVAYFVVNGMRSFKAILTELDQRKLDNASMVKFLNAKEWANHTNIFIKSSIVVKNPDSDAYDVSYNHFMELQPYGQLDIHLGSLF